VRTLSGIVVRQVITPRHAIRVDRHQTVGNIKPAWVFDVTQTDERTQRAA
jgi:hypothetical protein